MPPDGISRPPRTRLVALVEPERLFLPHLLARLAREGLLERIVVLERRRRLSARVRAARRVLACFGVSVTIRIAFANALAVLLDRVSRDRFYSLAKVARAFRIPVVRVASLDADETARLVSSTSCGAVFAHVAQLVPPRLLQRAEFWNKHCAPLPAYGGVFPVLWAMSRGEARLGVTVHRMNEKFDEGPVLSQAEIDAAGRTFFGAYHELYDLGADLIVELALDGRARTTPGVNARSYFGWPDATTRREFGRRGGRFGRPFRLHPRLAPPS
jgi:formyl transferase-like protein